MGDSGDNNKKLGTAEEVFSLIQEYVEQIRGKNARIQREQEGMEVNVRNLLKAQEAVQELPKRIESQKETIRKSKESLLEMERKLQDKVRVMAEIKKRDEDVGRSPNPLIEQGKSSAEIYEEMRDFLEQQGIMKKG